MVKVKRVSELTAEQMKQELRRYFIGRHEPAKALRRAYWRNARRLISKKKGSARKLYLPKDHIVVASPSGSGKTILITNPAKAFGIPLVECDLTTVRAEGYVGCKPRDIIQALLEEVEGNASLGQHAIIHLDEVDKIRSTAR